MLHLYYSIPVFDHVVYKYEGQVDSREGHDRDGIQLIIIDEYLGDRILEDGTLFGEHVPKKIILCKTRPDGEGGEEVVQMCWSYRSTPTSERLAKNFAKDYDWTIHLFDQHDSKYWHKSAEEHKRMT